jgi:hypothetical protein
MQAGLQAAEILEDLAPQEAGRLADETLARERRRIEIVNRIGPKAVTVLIDPPRVAVYAGRLTIGRERRDCCANRARQ